MPTATAMPTAAPAYAVAPGLRWTHRRDHQQGNGDQQLCGSYHRRKGRMPVDEFPASSVDAGESKKRQDRVTKLPMEESR
jgi:hypothetical protein